MRLVHGEDQPTIRTSSVNEHNPSRLMPKQSRDEWRRVLEMAKQYPGWIPTADIPTLTAYCSTWALFVESHTPFELDSESRAYKGAGPSAALRRGCMRFYPGRSPYSSGSRARSRSSGIGAVKASFKDLCSAFGTRLIDSHAR
jgi:hypothetical protein